LREDPEGEEPLHPEPRLLLDEAKGEARRLARSLRRWLPHLVLAEVADEDFLESLRRIVEQEARRG
jgi:hypothetical protein